MNFSKENAGRRCANRILRSIGLNVRLQKVDADKYSMTHKGSPWVDMHGVDSITAAKIIKATNIK